MSQEITIKIPMFGQALAGGNGTSSADILAAPPPDPVGQITMGSMTAAITNGPVAPPPDNAAFFSDPGNVAAVAPGPEMQTPSSSYVAVQTDSIAPAPKEALADARSDSLAPEPSASDLIAAAGNFQTNNSAPPPDLPDMQITETVPIPGFDANPVTKPSEKKSTSPSRAKK